MANFITTDAQFDSLTLHESFIATVFQVFVGKGSQLQEVPLADINVYVPAGTEIVFNLAWLISQGNKPGNAALFLQVAAEDQRGSDGTAIVDRRWGNMVTNDPSHPCHVEAMTVDIAAKLVAIHALFIIVINPKSWLVSKP
eukprot:6592060-Pyramimonas_sp.AAC.1